MFRVCFYTDRCTFYRQRVDYTRHNLIMCIVSDMEKALMQSKEWV